MKKFNWNDMNGYERLTLILVIIVITSIFVGSFSACMNRSSKNKVKTQEGLEHLKYELIETAIQKFNRCSIDRELKFRLKVDWVILRLKNSMEKLKERNRSLELEISERGEFQHRLVGEIVSDIFEGETLIPDKLDAKPIDFNPHLERIKELWEEYDKISCKSFEDILAIWIDIRDRLKKCHEGFKKIEPSTLPNWKQIYEVYDFKEYEKETKRIEDNF
jgi:hypothetical protein